MMQLMYEKLPKDIASRHVLLLDPVLATGFTLYTFYFSIIGKHTLKITHLLCAHGLACSSNVTLNLIHSFLIKNNYQKNICLRYFTNTIFLTKCFHISFFLKIIIHYVYELNNT